MVQRSGASPIWIPQESITAIRTERGMAGKVVPGGWARQRSTPDADGNAPKQTESWPSGGGCRRAPRSTSGFAATTATSTPAGYRWRNHPLAGKHR